MIIKKQLHFVLVAVCLFGCFTVFAAPIQQRITVSGTVVDAATKEPIVFATIVVAENQRVGTYTDEAGKYQISVEPGQSLVFGLIGYTSQTVLVNNRTVINVELQPDGIMFEETIVVAYGTSTKSSFTGSASQMSEKKLEMRPVTNATNALAGISPGVQLSAANGHPGSDATIRIRGIGSVSASNNPLIILDGMPYDGVISNINPADIESISVLKDASSSALYGARAANGVVMITTKKGNADRTEVQVRISNGFTSRGIPEYDRVGINDYLTLYWESAKNQSIKGGMTPELAAERASNNLFNQLKYNPYNIPADQVVRTDGTVNPNGKLLWGEDLDWQKAIEQLGHRQDYLVSLSGRNTKTDYYASFGYTSEKGYIIGSDFERYSGRTNINSQVTSFLKVGFNLAANMTSSKGFQDEGMGNLSNPFLFTRTMGPIYPIHLHNPLDGSYMLDGNGNKLYDFGIGGYLEDGITELPKREFASAVNPAIELRNRVDELKRQTFTAKPYIEINFLKDFKLTLNAAVTTNAYLGTAVAIVYPEKGNTGSSSKSNSFTTTWTLNQLLTWNRSFNDHNFDVLVGHESYSYEYNYLAASLKDQILSGNGELANYVNINTQPNSYTNKYRTEGYLSRLNYNYKNTYLLSLSFRRDGSSRFYHDTAWGNFWSIGTAWRLEQEKFIQDIPFIDQLKLRASYGQVGNDNIGSYFPWQALYEKSQNANEPGYVQSTLGNRQLKWEVNDSYDAALEFGLFKRIRGSVEYFYRQSSNLLFSVPLSPSTGIDSQDLNSGTMLNTGLEFQISADLIKSRDLTWTLDLNGTTIKNKITYLPRDPYNINSNYQRMEEGHSRYDWWLLQWAGVDPATGDGLYIPMDGATNTKQVNGMTVTTDINQAKEDWSGTASPKIFGGFGTSLAYKNLSFSVLFSYQMGGTMYDFNYYYLMSPNSRPYTSLHSDLLGRWNTPGQITDIPRIDEVNDSIKGIRSTRWLISSNMLELSNINLSYLLPAKYTSKIGVNNLRFYVAADHLFLLSKRKGLNVNYGMSGYDNNANRYTQARTFTIGLNFNL